MLGAVFETLHERITAAGKLNRRLFFAFLLAAFALVSIITLKVKPFRQNVLEVMLPGGYRIGR